MRQYFRTSKQRAHQQPYATTLVLRLLLTWALSVVGIPAVSAQESAPASDDARDTGQNAQQAPKDAPVKKASGSASGKEEVFVPTEEISEDYAVSFPVDI